MATLIKQPLPSSLSPNLRDFVIDFKYPHYPEDFEQNIFFSLQAYDVCDNGDGTTGRGGLHYGTALLACSIVAGNGWNGYFTLDNGGTKLDIGDDQLLNDSAYYFHIPTATETSTNYPIYPSFHEWAFPHRNLPEAWTRPTGFTEHPNVPSPSSNITAAVLQRDSTCLVTGQRDCMERAHLCPYSERKWFTNNHMSKYNTNRKLPPDQSTDNVSNAIALRYDIHAAFDSQIFAIVSKQGL